MNNANEIISGEKNALLFAILRTGLVKEYAHTGIKLTSEDFCELLRLAKQHEVQPVVAYGLLLSGGLTSEQEQYCRSLIYKVLVYQERMEQELHRICALLEAGNCDYMPLKGAVIRSFYPEPWMRTSGDIDILVKDVNRAVRLLEKSGYQNKGRGSHDVTMISPMGILVELHFQLIDTDTSVSAILERIWEYAAPREGTCHYEMEPEMFYLYHIAHMVKHCIGRGCGIRFFVDIWLMTEKLPMNPERKNEWLRRTGLAVFAEKAERLSQVWFGDREPDTLLLDLEQFVLSGGIFGSQSTVTKLHRAKSDNRVAYLFLRIFKPYHKMILKYPVLKKCPVLLPIFWVVRWIELMSDRRKLRGSMRELGLSREMDEDTVSATRKLFQELDLF